MALTTPPLAVRDLRPEVMDQPGLDAALHTEALRGLRRINRLSRTSAVLWRAVGDWVPSNGRGDVPLRILDVACGGGEVAIDMARRACRAGVAVEITGCDISPLAVEVAARQARSAGVTNVHFVCRDVLRDELPDGHDVVICSLFLHHLERQDAVSLLRRAAADCRLMLISDLRRGPIGWALAWIVCRLLTRSPVVRADGPQSVAAAFTLAEAEELARQAGLRDVRVARHWPQRYLLTWRRA